MSNKNHGIAELISQIQEEGILKVNRERDTIINNANESAQSLISDAKQKVQDMYETCDMECKQKKEDLNCELKMATRDFLLMFSKQIKTFIILPSIKSNVDKVMTDTNFLKMCLKDIFTKFLEMDNKNILLCLNSKTKNDMIEFFSTDIFTKMFKKNNISFSFTDEFEGFQIIKQDDKIIWDFTVEALAQEISKLVEPNLIEYFIQ